LDGVKKRKKEAKKRGAEPQEKREEGGTPGKGKRKKTP